MNFENLPDNWKVVRLRRVAEIIGHGVNPQIYPDDKFWLYSFEAYDKNSFPEIKLGKEIKSNKIILTRDCVLFARLNPRKGRIWKVRLKNDFANIASTEFIPFSPRSNMDLDYLYWVLRVLILPEAQGNISGTTKSRERVSKEFISDFPIPLPPLPEQKRIVEILSLTEDLIKKQKEAIALIDKILMAKFLEMFGDPATNPKEWEVKRLGEVVKPIRNTVLPQEAKSLYVGLEHVQSGEIFLRKWGTSSEVVSAKYEFQKGQILYGKLRWIRL